MQALFEDIGDSLFKIFHRLVLFKTQPRQLHVQCFYIALRLLLLLLQLLLVLSHFELNGFLYRISPKLRVVLGFAQKEAWVTFVHFLLNLRECHELIHVLQELVMVIMAVQAIQLVVQITLFDLITKTLKSLLLRANHDLVNTTLHSIVYVHLQLRVCQV